jgi:hypothetical protein
MAVLLAGAGIRRYRPDGRGYGHKNLPAGAGTGIKIRPRVANGHQLSPAGIPATRI